jgi:predicted DNA-binding transcriptional regulator YafY
VGEARTGTGRRWSSCCRPPWCAAARCASSTPAGRPPAAAPPTGSWTRGLVDKDDVWYLVAGTDRGQRTFRLDRIVEAEVTDLPAGRPADSELAEAWQRVVEEVEQRRSGASATLLVDARLVPGLRMSFGRYAEVVGEEPDGRLRARVAAQSTTAVAEQLAGWATLVEVVGPRR